MAWLEIARGCGLEREYSNVRREADHQGPGCQPELFRINQLPCTTREDDKHAAADEVVFTLAGKSAEQIAKPVNSHVQACLPV